MLHRYRLLAFALSLILGVAGDFPAYAQDLTFEAKAKGLAHYIMAVNHDLNGEATQAIAQYEKSVTYNPQEKAPRLRLGAYYVRFGNLEEAAKQLQAVIAEAPQEVQAHYLLALIYSSQRKFDQAAASYESILKYAAQNNPDSIEIYQYLAQLYYSQHQYEKAIAQYHKIIEIQPKNVSALFTLGSIYVDIQERASAMEVFRKVLALEPAHDGALNALGYMYAQDAEHLDEAVRMIRQAIQIDPSNGAYYDSLGFALFKQGLNAEALMALQKAETYIINPIVYEHIGDVYQAVNEIALARKYFRKSLDLDPHQPLVSQKIQQLEKIQALKE